MYCFKFGDNLGIFVLFTQPYRPLYPPNRDTTCPTFLRYILAVFGLNNYYFIYLLIVTLIFFIIVSFPSYLDQSSRFILFLKVMSNLVDLIIKVELEVSHAFFLLFSMYNVSSGASLT